MAWWAWLVVAWVLVACLGGLVLGVGIGMAERLEWARRGRPDRRERPRSLAPGDSEPNIVLQQNTVDPAPAFHDSAPLQAPPVASDK